MVQSTAEYETALRETVDRIAAQFRPDKIILFGSWARGEGTLDSDADLLIVMPVADSKRQQAVQIDLALEGIGIPIDLIVVRPEDIETSRQTAGTIIAEALREGKVLYDRAA